MRALPVAFVWQSVEVIDGDGVAARRMAMVPLARYGNVCARQFSDGAEYILGPIEARNMKSHNAYFAELHSAFQSIPESIAARWPTEEHLRKWLLVETGWFDEKEFTFEGRHADRDARRLAAFIRTEDMYARITVSRVADDKVKVIVRRAKSQAVAEMGNEDFKQSKKDVLDMLTDMIGVARGDLSREARRRSA